jgi:hypothetical protein
MDPEEQPPETSFSEGARGGGSAAAGALASDNAVFARAPWGGRYSLTGIIAEYQATQ